MGQYWTFVNLTLETRVEPHYYGSGAKVMEFAFDSRSLRVLYALLNGRWKDTSLAIVGDYSKSKWGKKYNTFPKTSLLNLTEVRSEFVNPGVDHEYAQSHGLVELKQSVTLPEQTFFVCNVEKKQKIPVLASAHDSQAFVASLLWLFMDDDSMGEGSGDVTCQDGTVHDLCGLWAGQKIRVTNDDPTEFTTLDEDENFEELLTFFEGVYARQRA